MENLTDFIKKEKQKKEQQNPSSNPKSSLLSLKNALDGFESPVNNPILENVKKVDTIVESRENPNFVKPNLPGTPVQKIQQPHQTFDEKEDQFTRDLLMKSRQLVNKVTTQEPIQEQTYHPQPVQPDTYYNHQQSYQPSSQNNFDKNDAIKVLKDTLTDLYVTEKIESVIKDYLQTEEGKKLLKSIVIGLFKKK